MNNSFHDLVLSLPLTDEVFDKLNTAANRSALRKNRHLTKHQFTALWEKNLPADEAASLVDRPLDADQIDLVLASERRGTVLLSLFRRPQLTREQQEKCVSVATGSTFASMAMTSRFIHPDVLPVAAKHLDGVNRLEWCAAHLGDFDDDQIHDALIEVCNAKLPVRDMRSFNQTAAKILFARPALVAKIASLEEIPVALLTTLAGSRFLTEIEHQRKLFASANEEETEFAALAFAANPVAHEEVVRSLQNHRSPKVTSAVAKRLSEPFVTLPSAFESIEDPSEISRLLRRCLPNQYRSYGRPGDLVALATNEHLSAPDGLKVFNALSSCPTDLCSADQLNAALRHLAERFSLDLPAEKVEIGFWTTSRAPYTIFEDSSTWILDPGHRPWQIEDTETLTAFHRTELDRLASMSLAQIIYANKPMVHLYLVLNLGLEPSRWEMLLSLSGSHLGSLSRLVMATIKLAR